jgi:hypothetical protein
MTEEQMKLLEEWRLAKAEADSVKPILAKEQELRKQVFAAFYPAPKEGTNTLDLAEGWKLKGVYKLDRKIDEAALPAVTEQLREMGVNADILVKWSPGLKTATYKELTAEQRAVFDQALTVKPGSPTLELVAPKAKE